MLISIILLVSCSTGPTQPASISDIAKATSTKEQTSALTAQVPPATTQLIPTPQATPSSNCASADINQIGKSIAQPYAFTSKEEVMTWFCDGAEFEDILMALQTEELNGTPAEDMLEMQAEGLSWDDIWLVVGYVEE